jgi:hypothetical protein
LCFKAEDATRQAEFQPPTQVSITLYISPQRISIQTTHSQATAAGRPDHPPDSLHPCIHFPSTNAMIMSSQFPNPESHPSLSMMSKTSQILHLQAAARYHHHHNPKTQQTPRGTWKNSRDEFAARCSNQEADSIHPIHPSPPL